MISFIVLLLYSFLIIGLIKGNLNLRRDEGKRINENTPFVSIVVPFRNEENNLKTIFEALKFQNYPKGKYEVLFVNDHSDDNSVDLLKELIASGENNFSQHQNLMEGKKEAIKKGVALAKGDFIITTDADCKMGPDWLGEMINSWQKNDADFIIGPVSIPGSALSFQSTEFASIIAVTSGAVGIGKPIICNGANLGFRKAIFEQLNPYEKHKKELSGDDVFFLHELKKSLGNAKINFAASEKVIVYTQPIANGVKFINQRTRWAKKTRLYNDKDSWLVGLIISLMNVIMLYQIAIGDWRTFMAFFLIKLCLDTVLLLSAKSWIGLKFIPTNAIILSLVYPFYFLSFALLSLLYKPKWKGRKT